jgi:hypothetical protein
MKYFKTSQSYIKELHEKIADTLDETVNSIRKLEE